MAREGAILFQRLVRSGNDGEFSERSTMIKRAEQQTLETRTNMRGGTGTIAFRHYFTKDEMQAPCRLFAQITIPPEGSIGLHEHLNEDEVYIVQHGRGMLIDGDREIAVSAGDAILTGNGASHAVRNSGSEDLVILAVIVQY